MRTSWKYAGVLAAALVLSGCGSKTDDAEQQAESAAIAPEPAPEVSATEETAPAETAADVAKVEAPAAFAHCSSCHSVEQGRHGVGPSLFAVYGTKAGDIAGYNFSSALKESGLTWDDATLDQWIEKPAKLAPGNKMTYPGMADAAKRKAIIDYMKELK